jgi:hypothetical protein
VLLKRFCNSVANNPRELEVFDRQTPINLIALDLRHMIKTKYNFTIYNSKKLNYIL